MALLTRSDFESAVKDALRHYTQADLLADNALLRTRLLTRAGPGAATPQALRALLSETARALFAGERDRRLYRVLDLTYLNPAPKQEAAAERLGLSFSTYRRHLTAGIDRLIEWLWQEEQQASQTEAPAPDVVQTPSSSVRPRLSIVILPFLNLSGDASVDYLVDGIVDSLITDLSGRLVGSFVISRSTAFTYKGRSVPVRQVGQELSVRYLLEGSMLVDPHRVRVNVQLIDAETDEHVWAERFDKERRDLLQIQDEIVGRLSRSVGFEMIRTEAARPSSTGVGSDAVDLVMRGRALVNNVKRREDAAAALDLFRQALELDPHCTSAMAGIALARIYQVVNLYLVDGKGTLLDEAEEMIARAMALEPDHYVAPKARGLLLRARGRFAEAIVVTEALIARNAAEPAAYKEMGLNKLYLGATREAAEWFRRADAVAPRDAERWTWLQGLGRALMQLGHDSEAVAVLSQAMDGNPGYVRGRAWLAAAEALSGDLERAQLHLAEYMALEPGMTVARFVKERSSVPVEVTSHVYQHEIERILEGLRLAGMPDGSDARLARGPESILPEAGRGTPYGNSGKLSQSVTELIGRETELAEVAHLIRTHRLVTLIGEGGIGKTRLGLEVARQLQPEFDDGARVAEFAPLSDPVLVPVAVAMVLGLELSPGAMSAERVAKALGGKQLLLVLDNCEHLIDAAAGMAEALLRADAAIRVLVTSREPLRTEGEYLYRVPPLAVPAEDTDDLEELLRYGAVLLFVTRARAADPHFSPDGRIGPVAAAICRRLDGIPLAIELAAARGAALGVTEIASRLDNRFDLLTGGDRTALPRHQTLRATLDWSYELLPEPERAVLRRLAIFAGGFTLAAARAVADTGEITSSDVVEHLAHLVAKSLVARDIGCPSVRYRLLETPRAYALEKLTEAGEFQSIALSHAEHYRDLLTAAAADETAGDDRWVNYAPEIDNVRAALAWSFGPGGDGSIAVALSAVSAPLWLEMSLLNECSGWTGKAVADLDAADRGTRHEMQLQAALGLSLMFTKGMTSEAEIALMRAVELAENLDDPDYQLRTLFGLWVFRFRRADCRSALRLARQCEAVASRVNDPSARPTADTMLGLSLYCLGNLVGGRTHLERVRDARRRAPQRTEIVRLGFDQRAYALGVLGIIRWLQGFPDQATRASQTSLDEAQMLGHPLSLCLTTWTRTLVSVWNGDLAAAEQSTANLIEHTKKHSLYNYHAYGLGFRGELFAVRGNVGTGVELLRSSLDGLRKARHQVFYSVFVGKLAKVLAAGGNLDESFAMLDEAVRDVERSGESWYLPELLRIRGELLLSLREPNTAGAEDHFSRSLALARRQGALSWELRTATSLCRLWHGLKRTEAALELLASVYDRFTEGFETADLRAAKALIDQLRANIPSGPQVVRGADAARSDPFTNLPEPISELIGRETELSEVADLIRTHRLVTLIGDGGIGKTRLGLEVARQLLPEFADGAWVIELAPLSDPELVPGTIATALGLNIAAGAISAERIADALGTKRLVLVLDNCEHVIDMAANMARRLVQTNLAIRVVATSREPLRTAGECLYRVPPLAVPGESIEDSEELLRHGALQLFVSRAQAADRRFSPDRPTAAVAAGICRRLDGIPLAIELAAVRVVALGVGELASLLDDRFHLLASGYRTAPARHQTLRATLDWSYELLPESERMVLRRLAIFAGNFSLEAATAVVADAEVSPADVIDGVGNLITKSLVTADVGDATQHYRLLETTRAYALEKLTESGELVSLGRRHAEYYRDFFQRIAAESERRPATEWLTASQSRIPNLRAALDWAFSSSGDAAVGVALTVAAVPMWMRLSLVDECRGRVEQALSTLGSDADRGTPHEMRLHAALGASVIYTKGPAPEAGAAWANALEIAENLGDAECQLRIRRCSNDMPTTPEGRECC
jgi:predicted ATPase/TolB-like protein